MKKLFCTILFLALAFRPIYHLSYIAYYECNIDAIVEKYCVNKEKPELQCNGKCHLAKKISLQTKNTEDTAIVNSVVEAFFPVFQEDTFKFNCKEKITIEKANNNYKTFTIRQSLLVCKDEQPPDFFV